jgi:hypothetical protein
MSPPSWQQGEPVTVHQSILRLEYRLLPSCGLAPIKPDHATGAVHTEPYKIRDSQATLDGSKFHRFH